jgi:putative transposase
VLTDPISLWNEGVVKRMGALSKYKESTVRYALLPRDTAKVTAEGILFRDCYYTCQAAVTGGWFVKARKSNYTIKVSFDTRSADCIYVHAQSSNGQPLRADLSSRSIKYKGLSLAEVAYYEKLKRAVMPEIEHSHNTSAVGLIMTTNPVVNGAKKRLTQAKSKLSRTGRRADIKPDRQAELREERNERAEATALAERPQSGDSAQVVSISTVKAAKTSQAATPSGATAKVSAETSSKQTIGAPTSIAISKTTNSSLKQSPTLEEIAQAAREQMFHG